MQMSEFNSMPTFFQALENIEFTEKNLMIAGDILVELGLEEKYGVFLLHRHFDISKNEVLAKFHDGEISVSAPVDRNTSNLLPTSWCVSPQIRNQIDVFEYSFDFDLVDCSDVSLILQRFLEANLDSIFGIYLRSSISDYSQSLFEVSDDTLRISLVSPWQDETHEEGWYKPSTFSFCKSHEGTGARLTNAGIACRNTTDCLGCAPSSPMIQQAISGLELDRSDDYSFDASDPLHLANFLSRVRSLNSMEDQPQ